MLVAVIRPFRSRGEAELAAERAKRSSNGWWHATIRQATHANAKPGEWEVAASSERFGDRGAVETFAARLNRTGSCRGKVVVQEVADVAVS
jgi:hypothetical protein